MKTTLFLFVAWIALLLSGCATRPSYSNQKTADTAVVRGISANLLKFAFAGEAHVSIVEIDGLYISPGPFGVRDVHIAPGSRLVTATFQAAEYKAAQATIQFIAQARKRYRLTATVVGIDFDVFLWDETNEEERILVRKWRISGEQRTPIVMPIVI
jgi:hypothetical protein